MSFKSSHLFVYIFLLTFSFVHSISNEKENSEVVFELPDLVPVKVRKLDPMTGETTFMGFNVDTKMLKFYNTTKEEIEEGYIEEKDGSTAEIVVSQGLRIPIQVRSDEVVRIHNKKGKVMFNLSKFGFMARKMKDLKGDKTLEPSWRKKVLPWPEIQRCNLSSLLVSVTPSSIEILAQNSIVIDHKIYGASKSNTWWSGQGIFVAAVNPSTCDVTYHEVFYTGDFGYFRELIWVLETIADGRIVILASLRDGSVVLNEARQKISSLGSFWSKFYSFRDGWVGAFVKGGKILNEVLLPNLGDILTSGSPAAVHVNVPFLPTVNSDQCCSSWPLSSAWVARRKFCTAYDGYGQLCDCTHPFIIGEHFEIKAGDSFNRTVMEQIPMIVIAGNRTRHLFRLLHSVGNQPGVRPESFLLAIDGFQETTEQLAAILGLRALIHRSEGITGKARVANNLRFGLYNAHMIYPNAKYFIVLEDDLLLAPDFYSYMSYLAPIFEMDKSIFCVSAFNHLAFPHSSSDPSRVYRAHTNPSLGWMISREILEFIVPKILPQQIDGDWDYFLGSEFVRGKREVLLPDVNRSYHPSTRGLHVTGSLSTELMYLARNMNNETDVKMMALSRLTKIEYEKEFRNLLSIATMVTFDDDGNLTPPIKSGNIYVMYVRKLNIDDEDSFIYAGDALGIWSNDARDHHNHAWRINYRNSTLFVVGVPVSPYSEYMPRNSSYLSAASTVTKDIQENQKAIYDALPVWTHSQHQNLPEFYYSFNHLHK